MKKLFLFLAISVFVFSCRNTANQPSDVDNFSWRLDSLAINNKLYLDNDSSKVAMNISLQFYYPSAYKNDSLLKQIQEVFSSAFLGDKTMNLLPEEAFKQKIKIIEDESIRLRNAARSDGDDFGEYYKSIKTSIVDTSRISITIKTKRESYTGGAHGSHEINYYIIDTRNGLQIEEDSLFIKNYKELLAPILNQYVANSKNSWGDSITLFEESSIKPNGNFYFNQEGLVYVYNEYEIAPYSEGLVKITLPYNEVKPIISKKYQPLVELYITHKNHTIKKRISSSGFYSHHN